MSGLRSRGAARFAANVATVLFALVIVYQLLLALGIVPITMAWGGRQSVLTPGLRVASLVAMGVLAGFAYVIRRRAGLLRQGPPPLWIKILAWLVTAYMAFNLLGNLTSPSMVEKLVLGPITLVLVIVCAVVALSKLSDLS
jgi:hypothetical protein